MDDLLLAPEAATPPAVTAPRRPGLEWRPKARWFAAEIVVVVTGVLIALAINAWWAARQQARDEQRLLSALRGEFGANGSAWGS